MSQGRSYISQLTLADQPNAVPWARRHAVDVLSRWQVPPDVVQAARLVVSELASGAVRCPADEPASPYAPDSTVGTFTVLLQLSGPRLFVQVSNRDPEPPVVRKSPAAAVEAAPTRGDLFLVEAMSHQWGYYHPRSRPGKVTWAELRLDGTGRRNQRELPAEAPGTADALLIGQVLVGLREL